MLEAETIYIYIYIYIYYTFKSFSISFVNVMSLKYKYILSHKLLHLMWSQGSCIFRTRSVLDGKCRYFVISSPWLFMVDGMCYLHWCKRSFYVPYVHNMYTYGHEFMSEIWWCDMLKSTVVWKTERYWPETSNCT